MCSQLHLPTFFLSPSFSCLFLFLSLFILFPQTNKRWQIAVWPSPLELSLVLQIPLAPGHERQCPKWFPSTDKNYLDLLWGLNSAIAVMMDSVWMRKGFCCVFKMSPNEFTECFQVKEHKTYFWPEQVTLSHELLLDSGKEE